MRKEIIRLFQKFIKNSCTKEELDKFYDYVKRSGSEPEINRLLTELWDYAAFTSNQVSDYLSDNVKSTEKKSKSFKKKASKINNQKHNAGNKALNGGQNDEID